MRIKMKTFEKLLPEAGVIKYDLDTKIVEADGKIVNFDEINIEQEFLKTQKEIILESQQEASKKE